MNGFLALPFANAAPVACYGSAEYVVQINKTFGALLKIVCEIKSHVTNARTETQCLAKSINH
jgi:hypothetical protein